MSNKTLRFTIPTNGLFNVTLEGKQAASFLLECSLIGAIRYAALFSVDFGAQTREGIHLSECVRRPPNGTLDSEITTLLFLVLLI